MLSLYFLVILSFSKPGHSSQLPEEKQIDENIGDTRRILRGSEVYDTRPYMVYLRPILGPENGYVAPNWLCGGVIIHERYVLTSAACIQEITYFYVVSGTHKWVPPSQTNECIENGAMRAIWKCVPRTYRYDGNHFNNIRWMVNDIAVVMTEERFSFTKRVKGCEFIPKAISYNNVSKSLEKPGTQGYIAGWGSTSEYTDAADIFTRTSVNSPILREAISIVIQKANCKSHWLKRYHNIIDKSMICGKIIPTLEMNGECDDHHVACRQLFFSEEEGPRSRRFETDPDRLLLESAAHVKKRQQYRKQDTRRQLGDYFTHGGFCENDHGGPFIIGEGKGAMVIGIISAYMTMNNTKKCFGPYLYASVFNNRKLIECALYKETGSKCEFLLRDSSIVLEEENVDWGDHPTRVWQFDDSPDYPLLRAVNDTASDRYANDTAYERYANETASDRYANDTGFDSSGPAYEDNDNVNPEVGTSTSKL